MVSTANLTDDERIAEVMKLNQSFRDHHIGDYVEVYLKLHNNDREHLIRVSDRRQPGLTYKDRIFFHAIYNEITKIDPKMVIPSLSEFNVMPEGERVISSDKDVLMAYKHSLENLNFDGVRRAYDYIQSMPVKKRKAANMSIMRDYQNYYSDELVQQELKKVGLQVVYNELYCLWGLIWVFV